MARKKIVAGNWKMNKTPSEAVALVEELKPLVANEDVDVVFCVPAIDIIPVAEAAKGTISRSVLRICILKKAELIQEKSLLLCLQMQE